MDLSFTNHPEQSSSARLQQLSDEVNRIASTLARLANNPGESSSQRAGGFLNNQQVPIPSTKAVKSAIAARKLRAKYFAPDLFADPAWDMLLDLLHAEIAQHRVPVSALCVAAAVPATTALRWIKTMTDAGLFRRRQDPHDGRRVFVELSPQTSFALRKYFSELQSVQAA